jgi:CheY-like chemotaxis protein
VVGDLLTVARGATCTKEVWDINQIVSGYLGSVEYREIAQRHPAVQINSYLEDKLLGIRCSSLHISKTIMNLVNNAAEAIQGKGQVNIATRNIYFSTPYEGYETIEPGEFVLLSVEDNGPGISEVDLKQIFSPFYSKKMMGRSGTGLGLAVVWNTMHDHGGLIDVVTSGQGTLFSLYFPVDRSDVHRPVQQQLMLHQYRGNGERILVVDDQKSQLDIARRLLSRLGYQPLTVRSGEEAVECIKKTPVDLVILDMIMDPGINGCETYRRIIKHTPRQKAIITSGYSSAEDIEQAMALGITQYIRKPYSLQELAQALKMEINPEPRTA